MFDTEFWAIIERFRVISNGRLSEIKQLMALLLLQWPGWKQDCAAEWFDTYQNQVKEIAELREIIQYESCTSNLESFVTTLIFHGQYIFESVLSQPTRLTEIGFRKPYSNRNQQLQETWFNHRFNMAWIIRGVLSMKNYMQDCETERQQLMDLEQRFPGILQDVTFHEVLRVKSTCNLYTTLDQYKKNFFKNHIHWNEFEQWAMQSNCPDLFF